MIKAAIEKIQEMARPIFREVDGRTFFVNGAGDAGEIRPTLDLKEVLNLSSLDALVKMIKTEAMKRYNAPLYITIPDHMTVQCFSQPDTEIRNIRETHYLANATDVPGWGEKVTMGFEEAQIALRTRFQETSDKTYALKLLTEISTGAKVTFNDNGIATTVVTKKGIDLQGTDTIRPIITLRPYRTFQEVEQPESQFLIRVSDRGITFVEADGGMWKLAARETIKAHLETALTGEISDGAVVIAL